MPVNVDWGNDEKTIVLFDVVGNFTVQEYLDGIEHRKKLQDTVDHMSSVVIDFSKCTAVPPNALGNFSKAAAIMAHPNYTGIIVVAEANNFIYQMSRIFSNVFSKLHFEKTREEAYARVLELMKGYL